MNQKYIKLFDKQFFIFWRLVEGKGMLRAGACPQFQAIRKIELGQYRSY